MKDEYVSKFPLNLIFDIISERRLEIFIFVKVLEPLLF